MSCRSPCSTPPDLRRNLTPPPLVRPYERRRADLAHRAYRPGVHPARRLLSKRELVYYVLRAVAAAGVVLSVLAVPHGLVAMLLCIASGLLAVFTCVATNAGGPGESAGTAAQARRFEQVRAPQGDWPPYDPGHVVDGELVERGPVRRLRS